MTATEAAKADARSPQLSPVTVQAYHALGELGLIPERTELLLPQFGVVMEPLFAGTP